MSERTEGHRAGRAWAAGGIWLASVALASLGAADALRHASLHAGGAQLVVALTASALAAATVGAVVAAKTGNPVGWLLSVSGLTLSAGLVGMVWAVTACEGGGSSSTWPAVVAIGGSATWWACLTTSIAVFPSGRFARGRIGSFLTAGPVLTWIGTTIVIVTTAAEPAASVRGLGFDGCAGNALPSGQVVGFALLVGGFVTLAIGELIRGTRLSGEERDRLMPIGLATSVVSLALMAGVIGSGDRSFSVDGAWPPGAVAAGLAIPVAVAVSVIRSRTFGIYRFIGFMADYRVWTVSLASVAVAAATSAGVAVATLVGLNEQPVVVALMTLAAAAVIFPFWRRRQSVVNMRFGQRQADPAAVLETLAANLDDEGAELPRGPVFDLLERFAPIVIVEAESGMRFAVRTDDREIGRHTFVNGAYDLDTMRAAMRLLGSELGRGPTPLAGLTVLDVGANIGISIVPLLKLFGAARGIAVEPEPDAAQMLRMNLELNDLTERVQVLPIGLSDLDGTLELELSAENFGDHRLRVPGTNPTDETSARRTLTVPVRRLDALVENGELDASSVGLIWLDVQGHEGHVLAGARRMLAAPVPVVTEFWPYALERAGGLDTFRELVASCFTRVVDVRLADESHVEVLPTSRIDELVRRYEGPASFTDLLLLP